MIKYKKVTYYVAMIYSTHVPYDYKLSYWYYKGRYPKEVINQMHDSLFKSFPNWNLGVVTFKVKVE